MQNVWGVAMVNEHALIKPYKITHKNDVSGGQTCVSDRKHQQEDIMTSVPIEDLRS